MTEEFKGVIHLCIHCSSKAKGSGKYCDQCSTAAGRKEMDEANRTLMPHYKCPEERQKVVS